MRYSRQRLGTNPFRERKVNKRNTADGADDIRGGGHNGG